LRPGRPVSRDLTDVELPAGTDQRVLKFLDAAEPHFETLIVLLVIAAVVFGLVAMG